LCFKACKKLKVCNLA
jgi:hypothetical protein